VETNYNTALLCYRLKPPSVAVEAQCGDQAQNQGDGILYCTNN